MIQLFLKPTAYCRRRSVQIRDVSVLMMDTSKLLSASGHATALNLLRRGINPPKNPMKQPEIGPKAP